MCHEFDQFDLDKDEHLEKVYKLWNEALDEFEDFVRLYDDWSYEDTRNLKARMTDRLMSVEGSPFKLNHYHYSDRHYNRCGDSSGESSGILTFLSYHQLLEKMKEFARKRSGPFCHHAFLQSISHLGIHYRDYETVDFNSEMIETDYNLGQIKESDLYKTEEYAEIIKGRQEEQRQANLRAEAKKAQETEVKERELYERLKKQFEPQLEPSEV